MEEEEEDSRKPRGRVSVLCGLTRDGTLLQLSRDSRKPIQETQRTRVSRAVRVVTGWDIVTVVMG